MTHYYILAPHDYHGLKDDPLWATLCKQFVEPESVVESGASCPECSMRLKDEVGREEGREEIG